MRFNFDRCSTFEYGEHKSVNLASVGDCTKITDTVQRLVYLFNALEHEGQRLVSLNLVQTSSGCRRHPRRQLVAVWFSWTVYRQLAENHSPR